MTTTGVLPLRVLLVEDDEADVFLTQRVLAEKAITWGIAEDGEAGLNLLRSGGSFDLILLDINMPNMDGYEFLDLARNELGDSCPPIVMLTTSRADTDIARAITARVDGYLAKDVRVSEFERMIETLRLGEQ